MKKKMSMAEYKNEYKGDKHMSGKKMPKMSKNVSKMSDKKMGLMKKMLTHAMMSKKAKKSYLKSKVR